MRAELSHRLNRFNKTLLNLEIDIDDGVYFGIPDTGPACDADKGIKEKIQAATEDIFEIIRQLIRLKVEEIRKIKCEDLLHSKTKKQMCF